MNKQFSYIGGRWSGKTTSLIKRSAKENLYIVCPTRHDALQIAEYAKSMNLKIPFPLTWDEYLSCRKKGIPALNKGVLIDDLDRCVSSHSGTPVIAFSISNEKLVKRMPLEDGSEGE